MGNLFASLFPFAIASVLVLGALLGSQLPVAQRDAAGRAIVIVLMVTAAAILVWLFVRYHNPRLTSLLFVIPAILSATLSQLFGRRRGARRLFLALGGLLMFAFGLLFSQLLPSPGPVAALQIFRWSMMFCGAFMLVAAWGNWLPPEATNGNEGLVRPALGRPPRHFGDAS